MKILCVATIAAVMAGTSASVAAAADLSAVQSSSSVDWNGFYAGFGGSFSLVSGPGATNEVYATGRVGWNKTVDSLLLGAQIYGSLRHDITPGSNGVVVGGDARLGVIATDSVAVYGSAGAFYDFDFAWSGTVGVGAEFAVANDVSLDLQYQHQWDMNAPYTAENVAASVLWHF